MDDSRKALAAVVARLAPLLGPIGFTWKSGDVGISSGGAFANGSFVGGAFDLDLIWRKSSGLGCPTYSVGHTHAAHDAVMERLGLAQECRLRFNDDLKVWKVYSSTGGDVVDALVADLAVAAPKFAGHPSDVRRAIIEAHAAAYRKLFKREPPGS